MRWPWRRREPMPSDDARHALDQARRALVDTERMAGRVDEVADQLAEIKRRNHFREAIEESMRRAHRA